MARPKVDCARAAIDALEGSYGGVRGALCVGSEMLSSVAQDGADSQAAACDAVSWLLWDAVELLDECVRAIRAEVAQGK